MTQYWIAALLVTFKRFLCMELIDITLLLSVSVFDKEQARESSNSLEYFLFPASLVALLELVGSQC